MERQISTAIDEAVNDFLVSVVKRRYDRNSAPQQHVFKINKVTGRYVSKLVSCISIAYGNG